MKEVSSGRDTTVNAAQRDLNIINYYRQAGEIFPIFANLPTLPAHFLGREEIVDELVQRLCAGGSSALSTAGQAGVGKTTLAVALAHRPAIRHHFRDGVLWASLGPNPDLIAVQNSWASAINVDLSDLNDPTQRSQRLANALGQRRLLLILDDIWHDLAHVNQLRWGNPNLSYLLTSRDEKLARSFAGKEGTLHLPELQEAPSIQLLQTLAPEAFAADAAAATALAKALGGLPLALELVGGYLANPERNAFIDLSQQALAEVNEPRHRLQLAQQRLGSTNNAQQTLEAAFALSLEHLPAHAVNAFYALGAFAAKPASFERAAAQAVAQCDGDTLALLLARNLLEQAGEQKEWLQLHQVTADVARQQLPPEAIVRQREYYFQVIDADRSDWQRIGSVYEQVQWAWSNASDAQSGSFVNRLAIYQTRQGRLPERIAWANQALRYATTSEQTGEMAVFLHALGYCYSDLGEKGKALEYYEQALALRRKVGDVGGEATTLNNLGSVYDALGEKGKALEYYEQALPMLRKVGNVNVEATTLNNLGSVYDDLGEKGKALEYYEQALALRRKVGDVGGEATTLNNLGSVYSDLGEKGKALEYYEQALPLRRKVGDSWGESVTRFNMAMAFEALNDLASAESQLQQVVAIDEAVGHPDLESDRAELQRIQAKRAQG